MDIAAPNQNVPPVSGFSGTDQVGAPPVVPDHTLIRCIGRGSYGEVWLAKNVMGTYRAVKLVYRHRFDDERPFQREFQGIQKFEPISRSHDGLMDILQVGRNDAEKSFYYVMELADDLVSGQQIDPENYRPRTLRREAGQEGCLSPGECVSLGLGLTDGLGALHQNGLVHRDIKPSNIIFVNGLPKPSDIGLVTSFEATRTYVGTEGFMPPEGPGSPQADIYSLGKVLYEMSTGKDRQQFPDLPTAMGSSPEREGLLEFNEVLVKACASDSQKRYQTAEEMHADLALLRSGRSVRRLRLVERHLALSIRIGFVGATLTLITLGGFFLQRNLALKAEALAQRAETALVKLEIQRAQELLDSDQGSTALALLASLVRQQPSNNVVVQKLMSTLVQRNFCLPASPPLQHGAEVRTAQFSPDGNQVLTASDDKKAVLWDWRKGKRLAEFSHSLPLFRAEFSSNGEFISTASMDHFAKVWDRRTGELVAQFEHGGSVHSALFDPGGKRLVTASADRTACVWDIQTGNLLARFNHSTGVPFATFSPDGRWIVTATWDGTAWLWDARTYQQRGEPIRHSVALKGDKALRYANFSPDSRLLVTASNDSAARVWDVITGAPFGDRLEHERLPVFFAQFNRTSRRLVTASGDFTARIWDLVGSQPQPLVLKHNNAVYYAEFSLDGERILTACHDGTARVWNAFTGEPMTEPIHHRGAIYFAHFSPDGQYILTGSADSAAQVWDVRPGRLLTEPLIHTNQLAEAESWVRWAEFSPDSRYVVTASEAWTARVWDVSTSQAVTPLLPHKERVVRAMFSPNGERILTASLDRTAQMWNAKTGNKLGVPLRQAGGIFCARFSRDGDYIVTAAADGTVQVWNAGNCQAIGMPMMHNERATWAEFSPDGRLAASSSFDKTARIWDAKTGQSKTAPLQHDGWVLFVHFSSDGRRVVTASTDKTARVWDSSTGRPILPPVQHDGQVLCAEFNHDGTKLVTGSADQYARIWDLVSGQLIAMLSHKAEIVAAHFSPNGEWVLTGSVDRTARLWDSKTGFPVTDPLQHAAYVMDAAFSPNGKWIVTASQDNTARLWELPLMHSAPPSWLPDFAEAIAGSRVEVTGIPRAVPGASFGDWKARIAAMPETGYYEQWAKWLLAERGSRPLSPSSGINAVDYVRHRLGADNVAELTSAINLAPTNALVLARLAVRLLPSNPARAMQAADRTEAIISRAFELAPHDPAIINTRAELLKRLGTLEKIPNDASVSR